ncbi:hypothetical protein ACLQ24_22040 [Micromonospora sp. DT4]
MSNMIERIRNHRDANRRARAIEHALRSANSPAVREELLVIAQRHMS